MVSKVLIFVLAIGAHASDVASMTPGDMLDFAQEIASKSTQEEHAILNTLLGDRATWHPDALTLLDDVDARPTRRLNDNSTISHGRRMAGMYCDGDTKEVCEAQIDAQCAMCKWSGSRCGTVSCDDYADQQTCCANAKNIATGCRWQTGSGGKCVMQDCTQVIGIYSDLADNAAKKAECDKNSGCYTGCGSMTGKAVTCMPGKASDWNCNCGETTSSCSSNAMANAGLDMGGRRLASERLLFLDIGQKCTMTDCVKCLAPLSIDVSKCSEKKTKVASGGECYDKCKTLVHCDKETECLFCGPKKGSGTCTPAQTARASCASIAWSSTTETVTQSCKAQCDAAKKCDTCTGAEAHKCEDPNAPAGGAVQTAGSLSVMIGLFVAMLYRLY